MTLQQHRRGARERALILEAEFVVGLDHRREEIRRLSQRRRHLHADGGRHAIRDRDIARRILPGDGDRGLPFEILCLLRQGACARLVAGGGERGGARLVERRQRRRLRRQRPVVMPETRSA